MALARVNQLFVTGYVAYNFVNQYKLGSHMITVHIALIISSAIGIVVCLLLGVRLGWSAKGTATRVVLCFLGIAIVLLSYTVIQAIVVDPLMRLLAGVDSTSGKTPYISYWVFGGMVAWVAFCIGVFRSGTATDLPNTPLNRDAE